MQNSGGRPHRDTGPLRPCAQTGLHREVVSLG